MRILVLFTRDLRVHDHPALAEACRTASEIVPLFVLDPALLGASANRDRFLLESLVDLDRSLERLGGRLFVRRGAVVDEAMTVAIEAGCSAIFVTGDASAYARRRERQLAEACERARLDLRVFPESAVVEPGGLPRANAYRVFTPYFRAWGQRPPGDLLPAPRRVIVPGDLEPGPRPDPVSVTPDAVDVPLGGERVGRRRLHAFLGRELGGYAEGRDDLAVEATSRLSPYLRFGCVSANEVAMRANEPPPPSRSSGSWRGATSSCSSSRRTRRSRGGASATRWGSPSPRCRRIARWPPGARVGPGSRSSTPGCASCCARGGCTTGRGSWPPRS